MRNEQTLRKLKRRLQEHLGKALDRVIIFGSVARGSSKVTSDIDVMVILDDELLEVNWRVEDDIISVVYPIELEDDVVFDLKVKGKKELQGIRGHTPFMERVMKEGITI
jgi:predicted nucleotidyltransferase